jgi:DNA-binding beta-propeller fold protein YncE
MAGAAYNGECWVVNGGNGEVVKLNSKGEVATFTQEGQELPCILAFGTPADYGTVNPKDGTFWLAHAAAGTVYKINPDNMSISAEIKFTGNQNPRSISVDPTDGSAWVGTDSGVFKVTADGQKRQIAPSGDAAYVSVNIKDGSCWVADSSGQMLKYSKTGSKLLASSVKLKEPKYIVVNSTTGNAWAADSQDGILVKLDANGNELLRTTEVGMPVSPAINFKTGDLWVADAKNFQVVKISKDGKVAATIPGFTFPASVSVDSKSGEVWVADQFANSVTKVAGNGKPIIAIPGFTLPISVSIGYWEGQ